MNSLKFALALSLFAAGAVQAQSLKFGGDRPIDVTSDNGFEVQTETKRIIFHGNAKAVQGEVTVTSDELIADYRTKEGGETEVYRVFANGNVTMKSANETATGEVAVYDFDKAVLVLEGKTVSLVNPDGSVTAHQTLQYWGNDGVAVAEGSAFAEDKDKRRLYGDKLIAFFREQPAPATGTKAIKTGTKGLNNVLPGSKGDINLIQGFGNVRMETATETVRGQRGTYNIETGIATLEGDVKISHNNIQSSGEFAVVNVKGGTSKLLPSAKAAGMQSVRENGRVAALIAPNPRQGVATPAAPPAAKAVK